MDKKTAKFAWYIRHLSKEWFLSRLILQTLFKPWPNGVASQRKLGNVNLWTQTCDWWPNGLARRRKFNASRKKAISVQPCTSACTKENNDETHLHRLALGAQTVKNLRLLVCKFELDQSKPKPSQVNASHGWTESQVNASFQLAITCDSVWPGLYTLESDERESDASNFNTYRETLEYNFGLNCQDSRFGLGCKCNALTTWTIEPNRGGSQLAS